MEILDQAIENLRRITGWHVDWNGQSHNDIDGILSLNNNQNQFQFPVETKKEFRNHHLARLLDLKKKYGKLMIAGETIYEKLKRALQLNGIAYIDGAGNIFIQDDTLFVFVEGKKSQLRQKEIRHKAFTKTGLKIVFHFLLDNELINAPYRQIAAYTGTSLDTISKTIASLEELGFIVKLNKTKSALVHKKDLLERWIYPYGDKLKPSLLLGAFRFLEKETKWRDFPINGDNTQWGGEPGADLLTNYLRPEVLTLYTKLSRTELMKKYRLVPDEKGNIQVFKQFWEEPGSSDQPVTPSLLIYADLVYSGDPRNIEISKRIYEKFLQREF